MNDQRPDPDRLLTKILEADAKAGVGRLKIFFGACAGVGKTYAMLQEALEAKERGVDVVGIVETHRRSDTEALVQGLEVLPPRLIQYRDTRRSELDVEALPARRPGLVLIDELAHSNPPGSRHPKRWQDIAEVRTAGIDVYTTVNVQHLESLNDVVGQITGVRVWETGWGPSHVNDALYLRNYMAQLRRKLERDPAQPRFLITEPGVGYRLALD